MVAGFVHKLTDALLIVLCALMIVAAAILSLVGSAVSGSRSFFE